MLPSFRKHPFNNKNKRKTLKVIIQLLIVSLLIVFFIKSVFINSEYTPLPSKNMTNSDGYIALSYFGVDRNGSAKYISKNELKRQLTYLKEQGFETISQQQIIDFHQKGIALPEKALFLSFEDGRNDSSIFSQKTLEELNYKATMFTYANKMDTKDTKFLKPIHLEAMLESGYWELGSNGNRLTYINVFNAKGQYLGEIDENNVPDKTTIEYYNHYLMDYLRNEYMIPKETKKEMEYRITTEYEKMKEIYEDKFGYIPKAYAIMHSNSLYNNMEKSVEFINDKMIHEYFAIHFNRDLISYNNRKEDLNNLNRLQVAPWWPVNHLLMKIQNDSKWPLEFIIGDVNIKKKWSVANGAGEFDENKMILTTEPGKEVKATLKEKLPPSFIANFRLKGSVMGEQSIFVMNSDGEELIKIILKKNKLYVKENNKSKEKQLKYMKPLNEINWNGEDYAFSKATQYDYLETQQGARIDKDEYPSTLNNDRNIKLEIDNQFLHIKVDNKEIIEIPFLSNSSSYKLAFGGSAIHRKTSNEQHIDTIYDSIIEDLVVISDEKTFYGATTNNDTFFRSISRWFSKVIDFFIEVF